MAGVGGFEPPHGGTKNRCLTAWLHPIAHGMPVFAEPADPIPRRRRRPGKALNSGDRDGLQASPRGQPAAGSGSGFHAARGGDVTLSPVPGPADNATSQCAPSSSLASAESRGVASKPGSRTIAAARSCENSGTRK